MHPSPRPGRPRPPLLAPTLVAAALVALVGTVWPAPVTAHPFGPPPRSWMVVEDTSVLLSWEASYDDYLALGEHLGHFEPGTTTAYLDPSVQVAPPRAEEEAFTSSQQLRRYLVDNVVVEQGGARCEPAGTRTEAFFERGAVVRHDCPEPPRELTLRISMLHDVNEAYRTFGLAEAGPPGPFAVFTAEQPEHRVDVAELTGDDGGRGRLVLFGALAVLAVGVPLAVRRLLRGPAS